MMLIIILFGVGGGVFMVEYVFNNRVIDFIRICIEVFLFFLFIVIGMFGLLMFVNLIGWGYMIIGGVFVLIVFNFFVMVCVIEDVICLVFKDLKEVFFVLGVLCWYIVKMVLILSVIFFIIIGVILVLGRVFGEVVVLLFIVGLIMLCFNFIEWNLFFEILLFNIFRLVEIFVVYIWNVNM